MVSQEADVFLFFENFQNKFYFAEFFHESLFELNKQTPEVAIEADGISQEPQQNEATC